jgi:hypothetical protein
LIVGNYYNKKPKTKTKTKKNKEEEKSGACPYYTKFPIFHFQFPSPS